MCIRDRYDVLQEISDHAKLQIVLNAVEKGSNPWGCTDYLNQKKKILETGADAVSYTHLDVYKRQLLVYTWLQMFVLFTVNNTENAAVVFDIILERMGIFLCHPST